MYTMLVVLYNTAGQAIYKWIVILFTFMTASCHRLVS